VDQITTINGADEHIPAIEMIKNGARSIPSRSWMQARVVKR